MFCPGPEEPRGFSPDVLPRARRTARIFTGCSVPDPKNGADFRRVFCPGPEEPRGFSPDVLPDPKNGEDFRLRRMFCPGPEEPRGFSQMFCPGPEEPRGFSAHVLPEHRFLIRINCFDFRGWANQLSFLIFQGQKSNKKTYVSTPKIKKKIKRNTKKSENTVQNSHGCSLFFPKF